MAIEATTPTTTTWQDEAAIQQEQPSPASADSQDTARFEGALNQGGGENLSAGVTDDEQDNVEQVVGHGGGELLADRGAADTTNQASKPLTAEERDTIKALDRHWGELGGHDSIATYGEITRLADDTSKPQDLREAAQYLKDHPEFFSSRLDEAAGAHKTPDNMISDKDIAALRKPAYQNDKLAEYAQRSQGNDTVYVSRTGEFAQYDKSADPSRPRVEHFKELISSLGPGDTISVEGLSAYGNHQDYLNDYDTAVKELGLTRDQAPRLEALASGIYPMKGSERANRYEQAGGSLGYDKFDRSVADVLNPTVQQDLKSTITQLARRDDVKAVAFDDHLAVPKDKQNQFFENHRSELPNQQGTPAELAQDPQNRQWAEDQITDQYRQYADIVRGQGKEVTVSIGGIGLSNQQFVDPKRLVQEGLVDRLEFQVYRGDQTSFNNELNAIRDMVRSDPAAFKNLKEIRIAVTETANDKTLSDEQKKAQIDSINALNNEIKQLTGRDLGVSYWASDKYFD